MRRLEPHWRFIACAAAGRDNNRYMCAADWNERTERNNLMRPLADRIESHLPAAFLLLTFLALAAYWPVFHCGFIWDDDSLLTNNSMIRASDGLYRFWFTTQPIDYWPVTNSNFWLEWRIWGTNALGYHLTNLALHIASSILIWSILRRLGIPGAYLAAILFAVHPVNVESVAWISERKNTLAMLFFLLSILWYLKDERRIPHGSVGAGRFYWLSLAAFVLAMLSKGSVAILPAVLLLIAWWQRRRIEISDIRKTTPFFVLAALLIYVNIWFQTHGSGNVIRTADTGQRLFGAGAVVWFYLAKAALPLNLSFVYPAWNIELKNWIWWMPLAAAVFASAFLFRYRRFGWCRALLFAWGLFLIGLVPVMGLADVYFMKYSLVADHYQYLAIIGVVAAAGAAWRFVVQFSRPAIGFVMGLIAIVCVGSLVVLTNHQVRIYRDQAALFRATLANNPLCWMAHNNLGLELMKTGRPAEALVQFRQAIAIKNDYPEAHNNLGMLLRDSRQFQAAENEFQQAIQLNPQYADAVFNLGLAFVMQEKMPQAVESFYRALEIDPNYAEVHNDLANVLFAQGQIEKSLAEYRKAIELKPDYTLARVNLADALLASGDLRSAISEYQTTLQMAPGDTATFAKLAKAYAAAKEPDKAISTAEAALKSAREQGDLDLAKQIDAWLFNYRDSQKINSPAPPIGR